jgi:hypothetical protein
MIIGGIFREVGRWSGERRSHEANRNGGEGGIYWWRGGIYGGGGEIAWTILRIRKLGLPSMSQTPPPQLKAWSLYELRNVRCSLDNAH